jgi:hypothetical protein
MSLPKTWKKQYRFFFGDLIMGLPILLKSLWTGAMPYSNILQIRFTISRNLPNLPKRHCRWLTFFFVSDLSFRTSPLPFE